MSVGSKDRETDGQTEVPKIMEIGSAMSEDKNRPAMWSPPRTYVWHLSFDALAIIRMRPRNGLESSVPVKILTFGAL